MQVPIKKEPHPQEESSDCPVELSNVQIIDKILQVPIKEEVYLQDKVGDCSV